MTTLHFVYIAVCRFIRIFACLGAVIELLAVARPTTHILAAGFVPATESAGVHGQVWNDVNHDGIHQTQEPGMAGITVTLYFTNSIVTTTLSNSTGHYTFTQLMPATYTLGVKTPTDFSFTLFGLGPDADDNVVRADGRTDPLALKAGNTLMQVDAGVWRSALVSDESATAQQRPIFLPFIASTK